MKYLSLALAAALATTLTACGGSDDKGNYNKPTLTPVTNPGTGGTTDGSTGGTTDGSTGGTTDGSTGGTTDTTEENNTDGTTDANNESEKGEGTELPGTDPVDNPGQAAYKGKATTDASSVGQQYRRGITSNFDRPLNSSKSGNATVFSWSSLENKKTTNIVNGRETVEIKAGSQALRRFTGQNTVNNAPVVNAPYSIQNVNGNNGNSDIDITGAKTIENIYAKTLVTNPANYNPQDSLRGDSAGLASLGTGHTYYKDGDTTKAAEPNAAPSNNDITGYFANTKNNFDRTNANNGLVKIDNGLTSNSVIGQEDQVVLPNKDGDVVRTLIAGQNSPTRVFGNLYNVADSADIDKDIAKNNANSWIFTKAQVYKLNAAKDDADTDPTYSKVGAATNTYNQVNKNSVVAIHGYDQLDAAATNGSGTYGLAAKAIKLNHVQYGRVTSNINALDKADVDSVIQGGIDKQAFFYAPYRNKFNYNDGENLGTTPNDTVDTYYYRGVGETTLEEMTKLPQDAKFVYNGHATSYGLDNSYHGSAKTGGTNSFAFGANQVGLGNFVSAEYDIGAKKVKGFIYNAWLPDIDKKEAVADKLVNFSGDVVGNTIVNGVSKLAYTPQDPTVPTDGAFKGSFYGSQADELGGAVNSVTEGYNDVKWGSVFGAQRAVVGSGNANQID